MNTESNSHPMIHQDQTARYMKISLSAVRDVARSEQKSGSRLIVIIALEEWNLIPGCSLFYVFEDRYSPRFTIYVASETDQPGITPESIADLFPVANLFEREIRDGFGIKFAGSYDTRRLFLHEAYPEGFHPLRKHTPNLPPKQPTREYENKTPYQFRDITGSGVFVIPVGPVHAGIIEPGHFRFNAIGETIISLEIRLGYLHRGVEKLAENRPPDAAIRIAESISGDESVVQACGLCMAAEQIAGVEIPRRAAYLRGILLELERSYALLSDLAGMVTDIAHPVSASILLNMRERLQQEADDLTGSRFMKGSIQIGGVSSELRTGALDRLFTTAGEIEKEVSTCAEWVLSIPTVIDRFATTGVIRPDLINTLSLSGPVARASGSDLDTRIIHPYGVYRERPPALRYGEGGDVLARFSLKYQEILAALRYIQELIVFLPEGELNIPVRVMDGYTCIALESARGMTVHFLAISQGVISRYKVRTASFCNWYALEHAVIGNIVPDFPLINKSLNLSYAGTDL